MHLPGRLLTFAHAPAPMGFHLVAHRRLVWPPRITVVASFVSWGSSRVQARCPG